MVNKGESMLNMSKGPRRGPDPDLPLTVFWAAVLLLCFFLQ